MEEKKHSVQLNERSDLYFSGILSVVSFQEEAVELESTMGFCQITGNDLHMEKLDLEKGEVILKGKIKSLYYPDMQENQNKGLFRKLFS